MPEIIEIGAVKINRDLEIVDRFEKLVKPRDMSRVTRRIQSLTGITPEDLEPESTFDEVWEEFARFTDFNLSRLCSWNTSFDIAVLREEYRCRGLGFPHNQAPVDALTAVWMFAALWGVKLGGSSLQKACERFEVKRSNIHRALWDAEAVASIFKEIRNLTLEDLEDGTSRKLLQPDSGAEG